MIEKNLLKFLIWIVLVVLWAIVNTAFLHFPPFWSGIPAGMVIMIIVLSI